MSELSTHHLTYSYPAGWKMTFPGLTCHAGNNLLIHGKSGSGKTTLLHLLAGLLTPAGGEIKFGDVVMSALGAAEKDRFRGQHIGMIFQKHLFIEGISLVENLKAARKMAGNPHDSGYLYSLMEALSIGHLAQKKANELSEGEQQRFSIARALANKPGWVLADEPTSGLDDANCASFMELMNRSAVAGPVSWLIASHDNRLKEHFAHVYHL